MYNKYECDNMIEIRKDDEYEVVIKKQDHFGDGIVRIKDMLVFVKDALPGDRLKIRISDVKKTYAVAQILEVIHSSDERVDPYCAYFDTCGGCQIMDQSYASQLVFKEKKVREIFKKFAEIDDLDIESISHGPEIHYRNKILFHGMNHILGFYREKSRALIPVKLCLLAEEDLNLVYGKIIDYLDEHPKTMITGLLLRKTSLDEIMLVVEGELEDEKSFLDAMDALSLTSVYVNNQLVLGKPAITEKIFEMQFQIYPEAFFQVNYVMMKVLYQIVLNYYKYKDYNKVLDLYCGTGTIGLLLSTYVSHVVGVEFSKDAIRSAKKNKEINHVENIEFIEGKVEDHIQQFRDIDSIVVDPPRSGLDSVTLQTILRLLPESVVYISCDPVTLARDLKLLLEEYTLTRTNLIDMFPNTYHVETVVILEKTQKRTFHQYGILVNKSHPYQMEDFNGMVLVKTQTVDGGETFVDEIAFEHYLLWKNQLAEEQIMIGIVNGYRTYEEEEQLYQKALEVLPKVKAEEEYAPPGFSEFHTGLLLELAVLKTPFKDDDEAYTKTFERIRELAPEYGFVLRYPRGKEKSTGFRYQPHQFRYVGSGLSHVLEKNGIVLEEYYNEKEKEENG